MNNVVAIIVKTLLNLGISPNTKGYHYLRDVILICVTSGEHITTFSKNLYAQMAEKYHTSECSIQRAVRHAIKSGWYRHNEELAGMIFINSLQSTNDIPTNSVFIYAVSEWLRINYPEITY